MESASAAAGESPEAGGSREGDKGLKAGAIGYLSNLVIGIASTAPAYSIAVTLGFVTAIAGMGFHAPAVMIVSFIPMLLIAAAYNYMNKADPDCGTSFTWVTRALGPRLGWLTGWTIVAADVVVMATLAYIAGVYTFLLFGLNAAAGNILDISIIAAVWIVAMTWICYVGIEISARTQFFLLAIEIFTLTLFAVVALWKVYVTGVPGSVHVGLSWFSPFGLPGGTTALVDGVLLGVFIYWGWDSGVCVNEESKDSANGPGKAAVMSTILLVLIYVVVAASAQAFHGPHFLTENSEDVLGALGGKVLGSPLDKLLIITVLTSASASTQTTILPTARTTLSMARFGSIPKAFGRIHPRYLTPDVSTLAMGGISLIWTLIIINLSTSVLSDAITGLGFQIAFYYGLTGFACTVYYRREIFKSVRNFFMVGLAPLLGGAALAFIFIKALITYSNPAETETGTSFLGVGVPVAIGVGLMLMGVIVMVFANIAYPAFFKRKPEVADPGILEGTVVGEASVMADP
jgi:amino acid transporter